MKEKILEIIARNDYKPMRFKDFIYLLGTHTPAQKENLKRALDELTAEHLIVLNEKERYVPYDAHLEKTGIYKAGKGNFGFVEIEDELFPYDVFVPGVHSLNAYDNDRVLVEIIKDAEGDKKPEGKITRILQRAPQIFVGIFHKHGKRLYAEVPGDRSESDIFIPEHAAGGAKHLDMVQVEVTKIPKLPYQKREGKVLAVLGSSLDDTVDTDVVICRHQLPVEFSEETIREADSLGTKAAQTDPNRRDLRASVFFTIDGKTAKDLDDAVCLVKTESEYILSVSIADVGHYVLQGSAIDADATDRGTSVYFPDRVIPMLPPTLSEQLCSLNPNEDKLTFTAEMHLDFEGKITDAAFYKSVLQSHARFVYDDVNALLRGEKDGDDDLYTRYRNELTDMKELADILYARRMKRGSIDLDLPEAQIEVNADGTVAAITMRQRGDAEKMIEEFMLCANRSVAEYIYHTGIPSVYRSHEEPDREKLTGFVRFASLFGYRLRLKDEHFSGQINRFLQEIEGKDEEYILKKLLLRSLKKAEYRVDETSHFALGFPYYTHFTSPIRRYPDLMVHRILSDIVGGTLTQNRLDFLNANLMGIASDCSKKERRAEEAEREADKLKMAQYMYDKRGEVFDGVVSSMMNFGFFVQLSNLAEGMVRFSDLSDDYYEVDLERLRAVGRRTSRTIGVGDRVSVEVKSVQRYTGDIDLYLLGGEVREHAHQ